MQPSSFRQFRRTWDSFSADVLGARGLVAFFAAVALIIGLGVLSGELLWLGLIVLGIVAFVLFVQRWGQTTFRLGDISEEKRRPLESTKQLAKHASPDQVPTGGVIEVFNFSFLRGGGPAQGAKVENIRIEQGDRWSDVDFPEALRQRLLNDPDNRKKYSLCSAEKPLEDRTICTLTVRETDWNSWITLHAPCRVK